MTKKAEKLTPSAERKRRRRETPEGKAYDRSRNRVLTKLAQRHPDEYQDLLRVEQEAELKKLRA